MGASEKLAATFHPNGDLLSAINALTLRGRRTFIREDDEADPKAKPEKTVGYEDPLIDQLEDAIRTSFGGTTVGASDPATRMPLNSIALERFVMIAHTISDWCWRDKVEYPKSGAGDALRRWYVHYAEQPVDEGRDERYAKRLRKWEQQIRDILDPVQEWDHPHWACPACGSDDWWSAQTRERYMWPLVTRFRRIDGEEMVINAVSMCRACGEVWSARGLAYELERAADMQDGNVADTA